MKIDIDRFIPVLDILQARLEHGAELKKQDEIWYLFDESGEAICSGETIRKMLVNLIFAEC